MQIIHTQHFADQLDKLTKKYPKISKDIDVFFAEFSPDHAQFLGLGLYKCRIKNSSIPTGKRDGFRLIIYAYRSHEKVMPIMIYSKSDKSNASMEEMEKHLAACLS